MRAWLAACCCVLATAAWAQATPARLTPSAWQREADLAVLAVPGWLADAGRLDRVDQRSDGVAPSAQAPLADIAAQWRGAALLFARDEPAQAWSARLRVLAQTAGLSLQRLAQAGYERLFGRLSEASLRHSAEDALAERVERDYLLFCRSQPWYRFDFVAPLKALWALPAEPGAGWRRWERRYLLSSVWGVRALAAAAARVFDSPAEEPATAVVVDRWLAPLGPAWPDLQRVRSFRDGSQLLLLPRRGDVTTRLLAMALEGVDFVEIAGNPEEATILLAVRAPLDWAPEQGEVELLHSQVVAGRAGESHLILRTSVGSLARQLREFQAAGVLLEKVFDY